MWCVPNAAAQQVTQTLRGVITDKESNLPLEGAVVLALKDSAVKGSSITDAAGQYSIASVPVGRIDVAVSLVGYKRVFIPNVTVTAAKQTVLNIEMESSAETIKEIVVTGARRGETINEMAVLSARAFTIEETERYAGSRGDPARMASNFAGVSGTDDSRNDLVIRGNSPFGVLYRIENVVVPNPNHFAVAGTTGGSVNILTSRMLSNSDFLTGAFPAEFGNAIAGVFDIRLKSGNNRRHEFTAQAGLFGLEAFGEGPLNRKTKSSYIFNYRYATLEALVRMGVDIGTEAIPYYQDLQFKFNFPMRNGDNLSVFGIGGYSYINFITSNKLRPEERDIYATQDMDEYFKAGVGMLGATYTHQVNSHEYSKTSLAISTQFNRNNFYRVVRHVDPQSGDFVLDSIYPKLAYYFINTRYTLAYLRNNKINTRSVLRYGITTELFQPFFVDSILQEPTFNPSVTEFRWVTRLNTTSGVHLLLQPFVQWKYAINEKLSSVLGVHGQYFTLSNSYSIEPRFSLRWQFKPNQSLGFGYGLHSQIHPVYQYFMQRNEGIRYNMGIDFTRSMHAVLGYDVFFKKDIRIKTETYFQFLWGIPVDTFPSSYNMLNEGTGFDRFFPGKLVNKGTGRNAGVEFTLEKFFTRNWFFMFTASVFDSRLRGSDGRWYHSNFNGQYILNALGTKEFKWGKKRVNTFGLGGKITFGGGQRYSPFDTTLSKLSDEPVIIDSLRNSLQFRPYFRFDIKLNYRCDTRKVTHEVGIDLVNVLMYKNILRVQYVGPDQPPREVYQLGFLPIFYYRIDFGFGRRGSD
ncbi:MAG: TonB-dependent receptor [Chitinophagales bacterium]|nr:TonB-dependent receptor [Chitinophagales bacterium]